MEYWEVVLGFENYEVGDQGSVRHRDTQKLVNLVFDSDGYVIVHLLKDGTTYRRRVHRLVMMAFSDWTDYSLTIDHFDNDKTNNCIDNLEYVTAAENSKRAHDKRLKNPWWFLE